MTTENAHRAHGEALPELYEYLAEMQTLAVRTQGLIDAAITLDDDTSCPDGAAACLYSAAEVLARLSSGLDAINLPEVRS